MMVKKVKRWKINKKVFLHRILTLILSVLMVLIITNTVIAANLKPEYKEVTIKSGDTLWDLVKSAYGSNVNIEKAIYEIRKLNHKTTSDIYPGEKLKIPLNL
ncbi:cell division suppressor protein YneA [Thermincola potens]|uniref:Peptidoglycan-binding lysin domain protein n=1 Tax=Thermincola potens (strain JR) TaxID=635013 RepID=D5XFD4_THEPJ|nr:LysM peptidoglycan-binding domain-containing protein [Thermincola potens]ADG82355.1 Peptidoglycan-binding lysin domain protein [Thermincola potens JR]